MSEEIFFNIDDLELSKTTGLLSEEEKEEEKTIENTEEEEEGKEKIEENKSDLEKSEETPSSEDNSSHSSSTLHALAKYLKEEGVLYLDEELKNVESLEDLKNLIAESNSKARYANLTDAQKRYQEALEAGVPQNEFEKIEKEIQTFESIKDEQVEADENLRYEIIALDLMQKGISQEQALKLAKLSLTDQTNVDDAKAALKNLVDSKKESYKTLLSEKNTQRELDLKEIKKSIDSKEKILDMSLNDITKNKLFDLMTTKVASDDNGLPMNKLQAWQKENPLESQILLNYLFMITNEGKDLSQIKKSSTSQVTKELEQKLKTLNFDKDGNLLIPDNFTDKTKKSNDSGTLTINI